MHIGVLKICSRVILPWQLIANRASLLSYHILFFTKVLPLPSRITLFGLAKNPLSGAGRSRRVVGRGPTPVVMLFGAWEALVGHAHTKHSTQMPEKKTISTNSRSTALTAAASNIVPFV